MSKPYGGGKPNFLDGMTPIGRIVHLWHDKPQLKTTDQLGKIPDIDPDTQIQRAEYKATVAWPKTRQAELSEMIALINRCKSEGWPESMKPGAFFALEPVFRDGDNPAHNTKAREYLFGHYYLNFKKKAEGVRNPQTGQIVYSGAPGLLGPQGPGHILMPTDVYAGCTGRVSFTMFATEYMGKHFISTRLQNIQKYEDGDRLAGGGTPHPDTQFGALVAPPAQGAMSGLAGLI